MTRILVGESDGIQGVVQKWYLVDRNRQFPETLTGALSEVGFNSAANYNFMERVFFKSWIDDDWNIFVRPYPGSEHFLTNSAGETNYTGEIEIEIKNPLIPFKDMLHHNMPITCKGWWVEDTGHTAEDFDDTEMFSSGTGKTEFHPFDYLIGGTLESGRFCIIMSQDRSSRFPLAGWDILENFDIPIATDAVTHVADNVGSLAVSTEIVEESSQVDTTTKSMGWSDATTLAYWAQRQTRARARMVPGNILLNVDMKGGGIVRPFLATTMNRFNDDLLQVKTTRHVIPGPGNSANILKISVAAQLDNPPQGSLAYSKWSYDQSSAFGGVIRTESQIPNPPHQIQYDILYSPQHGWSETSWNLVAMGCTRSESWSPNFRTEASQTGEIDAETRAFVQANLNFSLQPSRIFVSTTNINRTAHVPGPVAGPNVDAICHVGYRVKLSESLLAGAAGTVGWKITVMTTTDGAPRAISAVIDSATSAPNMTPGVAVDFGYGFKVKLVDDHNIEIRFDAAGGSSTTNGIYTLNQNHNHVEIVVTGYLHTDFGEYDETSSDVLRPRPCNIRRRTWEQFFDDIIKYGIAMEKLKDMGIIPDPWPPGPLIDM